MISHQFQSIDTKALVQIWEYFTWTIVYEMFPNLFLTGKPLFLKYMYTNNIIIYRT